MNALNGKVAVIGGASSGIGRAAALLFARQGATLVLGARRERLLAELVEDIRREGGRALAVAGDVCDEAFAERLTATAVDEFGGLDIAFNNAGTLGPLGPSLALSASEWRDVLETNLSSAYYSAKYQIPAMQARGAGSVIFTSTFVGHTAAFPGTAAYAASKSGLIGLTQALAVEFGGHGIRVNALLPGGTDTAMGRQMSNTPEALAQVAQLHALKRLAMPEEIAQAALYLASDASSFVTGTAMLVDGGVSIQRG
ncbi:MULTISPECIES: SDR family oxidoreductase [Serratia]|jgi:NAD(P)-dependent dehydrogenase (short-subunit alcohol dehydrogenase family)|uniref:SDR family oxidoreductase n=1 Tax=Serratia TaxID=613 RepID=UPI0018D3FF8B|nr:SDR family oxidoreductase [Serratia ureilytica]MBH1910869.1 SDR family oxidoreductase [Serratia ureilytica]MBS7518503.1 SDR family oxidoreductase [Serratia ureilytica]BEL94121.1 short-chain dehydrogenase [Serratia marcescens]BEM91792.1 short-chain dehydrogenase [Serratia marcescens]